MTYDLLESDLFQYSANLGLKADFPKDGMDIGLYDNRLLDAMHGGLGILEAMPGQRADNRLS